MSVPINKRLLACSSLVTEGAYLADVGTDHGYLPIYLLEGGKIQRAVLSDINEGPLAKARENVILFGLSDSVELILSDGASALSGKGITDLCVAGMGGELIAAIISKAPFIKTDRVKLILQPMSRPEALRAYLWDNGFEITNEIYVTDEGKHYVCLCAEFSGGSPEYSRADALFGRAEFFSPLSESMSAYMSAKLSSLCRVIEGKRLGGADFSEEEAVLSELRKRLSAK